MKILAQNIINDGHINNPFWVCALHYNFGASRPLRHIRPTRVIAIRNDSAYGYDVYALNKEGKPLRGKKFNIHSYQSWHIKLFTTEEECRTCYNELCNKQLTMIDDNIKNAIITANNLADEIRKFKNENITCSSI